MSMLTQTPELAEVAHAAIIEPSAAVNRILIARAIERGEIPVDRDVELLSLISPAMAAYQALILKQPVDRAFLISLIDTVVLPAATSPTQRPAGRGSAG